MAKRQRAYYQDVYGPKDASSTGDDGDQWTTRFIPVPVGRLLLDIYDEPAPLTPPLACPICKSTTQPARCAASPTGRGRCENRTPSHHVARPQG